MSKRKEVAVYVKKKLTFLTETSEAMSGAVLAKLRRAVGKSPGDSPELFGFILQDMPEDFWCEKGEVSKEEWACFLAITFYALHQQGNNVKNHNMNVDKKVSLGDALRRLAAVQGDTNAGERMQKKLQMVITSIDLKEFSQHLKGIVTLLRGEGIALNYAELAQDIYDFQFEDAKSKVSLKWGQDFYRKDKVKDNE